MTSTRVVFTVLEMVAMATELYVTLWIKIINTEFIQIKTIIEMWMTGQSRDTRASGKVYFIFHFDLGFHNFYYFLFITSIRTISHQVINKRRAD